MSTIPLSLAHLSELDVPPLELVELAARAGFASIGLRTSPASPGGVEYPLRREAEQAEMRRRLAANGMKVLEVEMVPLSGATRVADYRPMLETGAAIGASRLTVGGDSADVALSPTSSPKWRSSPCPTGSRSISNSCRSGRCGRFAHAVDVVSAPIIRTPTS